jgi:beta-glucanase (GH16 family)
MKERLFNLYLLAKAYYRKVFSFSEGTEDVIPNGYKKISYTLSEDGHAWGIYHPKFPYQYWDRMFVHKEFVPQNQRNSLKSLKVIYHLESSFYPRKIDNLNVSYGVGVLRSVKPYKYGYFTCKIAFPQAAGQWPAFWLYNGEGDNYSEIDIVEAYSKKGDYKGYTKFQPNIHYTDKGQWINTGAVSIPIPKRSNPFIKFSMLWEATHISIFYDGYLVKRYTDPKILEKMQEMYLILNAGVEDKIEKANKAVTTFSNIAIYKEIRR